jgi:hypothetical protein
VSQLWLKLAKCGVTGKLLNLIKYMYSKLISSVKHDGNFSDFFSCNIGLVQGESLSPFLYAMYVNDIEIELIKQGCQSYELKMLNLYLLMYADDTVLFSENVHELQNMINIVKQLKKSEKLPSCFTLDFNLEYIYLIRFKSFPVTPHLANFNHN